MKKILVFGSNGLVGKSLRRLLSKNLIKNIYFFQQEKTQIYFLLKKQKKLLIKLSQMF